MLLGPEVVKQMRDVEDAYAPSPTRGEPAPVEQPFTRVRYVDNVMRLTAALQ